MAYASSRDDHHIATAVLIYTIQEARTVKGPWAAANCQRANLYCLQPKSSSGAAPLASSLWGQCAKADGETATLEL